MVRFLGDGGNWREENFGGNFRGGEQQWVFMRVCEQLHGIK